jgi:hypothetical protein
MLGMLSSVVAAAGAIERGWRRIVRFIDRFKRMAGSSLVETCTANARMAMRSGAPEPRAMREPQCAPRKYGGLPASAARMADPGVVDWQASNPDKFGDKLIFAIGTKRRL